MSYTSLTGDQIEFTNAFNLQRGTLAGFAKCSNKAELDIVRDGLYLGLARDLQLPEYEPIRIHIVRDPQVADTAGTSQAFATMISSARACNFQREWQQLIQAVNTKAATVGSDLGGIWRTLETGRLLWLEAVSAVHSIKVLLKDTLEKDKATNSIGDVSDAKMVWIYGLSLNLNDELKSAAKTWANVVGLVDPAQPLKGYKPFLWDPRRPEWRPLDLGVQAAAEAGGSTLEEAWNA